MSDIVNGESGLSARTKINTAINGGTENKKDFIWNYDAIPNFDIDGMPGSGEADKLSLIGMYFDKARAHFSAGRVYERGAFPTTDAQYSAVFGWCNAACDQTESVDGHVSKGTFVAGYQNVSAGMFGSVVGKNNLNGNGGIALGRDNMVGGLSYQIIGQSTFVDDFTPGTITVAGDKRSTFTDGLIFAVKLFSPAQTPIVALNRVVSTSFDDTNTIITLKSPLLYHYEDSTVLDAFDGLRYSWACTLGVGNFGLSLGVYNTNYGENAITLGVGNKTFNNNQLAIGKQVVLRNKGEIGVGSGMIVSGTSLRYSQKSMWNLKGYTNSITPKELTLDSYAASQYVNTLSLQVNTTLALNLKVVGYCSYNQSAYAKTWNNVIIKTPSNGDSLILLEETPVVTAEAALSTCLAVLTVGANGKIIITVTGIASREIVWSAWVEGVIVGFDAPTKIN